MTTTINGKALEAERNIPAPVVYPDNTAFWDATNAGKLLIKHCTALFNALLLAFNIGKLA